ncbi:MAG TPA: hypothetical protein VF407_08425, partial [Polyangiaceae bacterium]
MYIARARAFRGLFGASFLGISAAAIVACGGVDGTTVAPDGEGDDTSSSVHTDDGDAGPTIDGGPTRADGGSHEQPDAGSGEIDSGKPAGPPLVYGITLDDIYSFDTTTDTIHHVANFSAG